MLLLRDATFPFEPLAISPILEKANREGLSITDLLDQEVQKYTVDILNAYMPIGLEITETFKHNYLNDCLRLIHQMPFDSDIHYVISIDFFIEVLKTQCDK